MAFVKLFKNWWIICSVFKMRYVEVDFKEIVICFVYVNEFLV